MKAIKINGTIRMNRDPVAAPAQFSDRIENHPEYGAVTDIESRTGASDE